MSDRPLQPGDLCELFGSKVDKDLNGSQCTIVSGPHFGPSHHWKTKKQHHPSEYYFISGLPFDAAMSKNLRRIPPKSDPIADFQKCDDEFLEDMQRWLRVKV